MPNQTTFDNVVQYLAFKAQENSTNRYKTLEEAEKHAQERAKGNPDAVICVAAIIKQYKAVKETKITLEERKLEYNKST